MSLIDGEWRITIDKTPDPDRLDVFVVDLGSRIEIFSSPPLSKIGDGAVLIIDRDRVEDDAIVAYFDLNGRAVNRDGVSFEGHYDVRSARLFPLAPLQIQVTGKAQRVGTATEDWTGNRPAANPS